SNEQDEVQLIVYRKRHTEVVTHPHHTESLYSSPKTPRVQFDRMVGKYKIPLYEDDNLDGAMTSYPSQMHAQSHTLLFATAFSLLNNVDMNTMDYRNAASDYASYQETANYPVSYQFPSHIETRSGQSNIPSHDQVENHTSRSYPAPVSCQTLLGFSAQNNYPSDSAINHSYIVTQMPMQMLLSSNNSNVINESTNSGYVVMKVECTHLDSVSAADIENYYQHLNN
ncbi:3560_t:CDS:2, partial [Paraglomus brasilianum]